MNQRRADLAGSWYPGKRSDCLESIKELMRNGLPCPCEQTVVGGVVPHAGWYYSGKAAFNVIRCMAGQDQPDTLLMFGRHLHPGSPNFIMKEGQWATPLGEIEIDGEVADKLVKEFSFTVETDTRYESENTIELQLPFIKYLMPKTRIVPMGLPPRKESLTIAKRAAAISHDLGRKTMVLGSTDLTHYGYNYDFTPRGVGEKAVEWVKEVNDRRVIDLMLLLDEERVLVESLHSFNACCGGAAASAIAGAKVLGAKSGAQLDYYTSYDIRPNSSFVGYVGICVLYLESGCSTLPR